MTKQLKILIVEDESIVAMDIESSLLSLGYNVVAIVSSGKEAIKVIKENSVNLILMDIRLKGNLDGIETSNLIKKICDIPIIYLTAYADDPTLDRAKLSEPYGYILKPYNIKELQTAIKIASYKFNIEKKLKDNENWLSNVLANTLKSIGDGFLAVDKEAKVLLLNKKGEEIIEVSHENVFEKQLDSFFILKDLETKSPIKCPIHQVLLSGKSFEAKKNFIFVTKKGEEKIIVNSVAPIFNNNNNVIGAVMVFRDVTEDVRIKDELIRKQKLESLGILAGSIAHDFNNYLTTIIGNVSLIEEKYKKYDFVRDRLGRVIKAGESAVDLTQQLLTFSKGGMPRKEIINIKQLIDNTATFSFTGTIVNYHIDINENIYNVNCDSRQISQVLNNIFTNASQAMPDGGDVFITVNNKNINSRDGASLKIIEGDYIEIEVRDQGLGIESDDIHIIFDPYYSTKEKGIGLGLTVSYSIVRNHKGIIIVDSILNKGTIFKVYLPATKSSN